MSGIAFQNVGNLQPGRTRFDWRKSFKFDCDFGQLIPIFAKELYPGDYINLNNDILVRTLPLIAPVMHECSIDTHYFFVATRTIDDYNSRPGGGNPKGDPLLLDGNQPPVDRFNFELYMTGGFDGQDNQTYPRWDDIRNKNIATQGDRFEREAPFQYSIFDYFGFPPITDSTYQPMPPVWLSPLTPIDDLRRCYNYIYNEYYRDETLINPVPWTNSKLLLRAWRKDYFTSSLPFQLRGLAPAVPVDLMGTLNAVFNGESYTGSEMFPIGMDTSLTGRIYDNTVNAPGVYVAPVIDQINQPTGAQLSTSNLGGSSVSGLFKEWLNKNTIDPQHLVTATFNIAQLREVTQLTKYLERNARTGVRISEMVKGRWGKNLGDARIDRPEYIGGSKQPLIISEVLQTSQTDNTPLATMGGHSISATGHHIGDYEAPEWGWIIGIMSIMPKPAYHQGIKKNYLKKTVLDWLQPEFVNLSEQEILAGELYLNHNSTDEEMWGYQGIYDELRTEEDTIAGGYRDVLNYWHLTRNFTSRPELNKEFIECNPKHLQRIFQQNERPNFLCEVDHNYYMVRPLPEIAEPGLLDHH